MTTYDLDAERAMLRALLGERRWNRAALRAQLEHLTPETFDRTFTLLVCEGLAVADRRDVQASRQLRHLADAGLLALGEENPYTGVIERTRARDALRDYARHRAEHAGDTMIVDELAPLIERASAAGLGLETIAALAEGR